jgi:hypothetical protein
MEAEEKPVCQAANTPERRQHPRHVVDEDATLLLLSQNSRISCRVTELSVEGCRLRTGVPFLAGIQVRIEVAFRIRGIAFRFSGVTEWTLDRRIVGILFVNVPLRRRDELVEVLLELEAEEEIRAVKASAEQVAAQAQAEIRVPIQEKENQRPAQPSQAPHTSKPAGQSGRDRRAQSRQAVDTSAVILLINIASQVHGRILDLSVGGCRIHTDERFPVGVYTRVETEFHLEGLPFRLGGVIQAIHDQCRQLVGIRFLDMSVRKREQVEQLIEEIEETRGGRKAC